MDAGILVLEDLCDEGVMKSFTALVQQCSLHQQQFLSYLQIRHLLTQTFRSTTTSLPSSDALSYVVKIFGTGLEASTCNSCSLEVLAIRALILNQPGRVISTYHS